MDKKTTKKDARKPYAKPELRCVELSTDEVLAKGCKLAFDGANFGDKTTCSVGSCVMADS